MAISHPAEQPLKASQPELREVSLNDKYSLDTARAY